MAFLGGFAEAAVLVMIARLAFALASDSDEITASLGPLGSISISVAALIGVAAGLTVLRIGTQFLQARQLAAIVHRDLGQHPAPTGHPVRGSVVGPAVGRARRPAAGVASPPTPHQRRDTVWLLAAGHRSRC